MPFGDRTGPEGRGPRTGLGYGSCSTTEHFYDKDTPKKIRCAFCDRVDVQWSESTGLYLCPEHLPYEDRVLA